MNNRNHVPPTWPNKFAHAARGVRIAIRGEKSFCVHLSIAVVVVITGLLFGMSINRWCLLVLCIAIVLVTEMLNTAIERLACAITKEANPKIRDALDIAAGAVLIASIGAAVVGLLLLGIPLLDWF